MNINESIIDQRVDVVAEQIRDQARHELGLRDAERLKCLVFVWLCARTILDREERDAFECVTEGGGDFKPLLPRCMDHVRSRYNSFLPRSAGET